MKKKILIIENDEAIRDVLSVILREEGYLVKAYNNEEAIFEHITSFKPDTILLDIIKPTLEGTELCRLIKKAESTRDISVIVLSTHLKIDQVKDICADEIIKKPFDINQLLAIIEGELAA